MPELTSVRKTFFTDSVLESVLLMEKKGDRFLQPNLKAINGKHGYKALNKGLGFEVLQLNQSDLIAKIERIILRTNPITHANSTHYPWMSLGFGQERQKLNTVNDAKERRRQHLANKRKFEEVGIITADYVGSAMINSVLDNKTGIVVPMYVEFWKKIPGKELTRRDESVDRLYQTKEGRDKLVNLALSIKKLSEIGYLCDVNYFDLLKGEYTVAKTKNGFPFPRNFFITKSKNSGQTELVAFDFNMGVDLTLMPWWKTEFKNDLFLKNQEGKFVPSPTAKEDMKKSVRLLISEKISEDDLENKDYTDRLLDESYVFLTQIDNLFGQLEVTTAILNKIKEIEGNTI
ncbi:MAG: hypothetical protein WC744_01840 [Patescibacteria group bacterium]|jgi:hypothetical protein